MTAKTENTIKVFHLDSLTRDEAEHLNEHGWENAGDRFTRYADITTGFSGRFVSQVIAAWRAGEYHEAAIVATDSLDWAYHQTNNISEVWSTNDDVTPITDQFKSTSVGDIMIDANGQAWLVAPVGFEKIDLPTTGSLKLCHECGERIEDGAELIEHEPTAEPPGFVFRCASCSKTDEPHHYFATFALGFAMGATREEAIQKLVNRFRADFKTIIRNEKKAGKSGAYVWTVRVDQESREYGIDFYQPKDVPMSDSREHAITKATVKSIEFVTTTGDAS